jgi:hypothetical protein
MCTLVSPIDKDIGTFAGKVQQLHVLQGQHFTFYRRFYKTTFKIVGGIFSISSKMKVKMFLIAKNTF